MKIIFNKPRRNSNNSKQDKTKKSIIFDIKNKTNNVLEKIKKNDAKLTYKHYSLLILMILIGVLSLKLNIDENERIDKEKYDTYTLKDNDSKEVVQANTKVEENVNYQTAVSSISTNVSNSNEKVVDTKKEKKTNTTKYIMPVQDKITKQYSKDKLILSETLGMWMTHEGIDIRADEDTNVVAILGGKVDSIYQDPLYGTSIIINHDNGYTSVYCNLKEDTNIKEGDKVKQGQVIGSVGKTAIIEVQDEPHIHLEILKDGINIDPANIGLK